MSKHQSHHQQSISDPSKFWLAAAEQNHWYKKPTIGVDTSASPYNQWFPDGELNACYNAVDVHVENGRADQAAIIYDSPVTNVKRTITFAQLQKDIAQFSGGLKKLGVEKGDRVLIYMPMIPEAIVAVLATARLGAIHTVVFGGFAANELAVRIDDCQPKIIVSASCGIEPTRIVKYKPLIDEACKLAKHPMNTSIVFQRKQCIAELNQERDIDWQDAINNVEPADCVPVASTHPLYVLYTSGTTGQPKGVVRDTGGTVVSLNWTMQNIYDTKPGDVYWAASDIGWVVGHSYIIYGPLLQGCTSLLYEGKPVGTPDAGAFWRVASEHKVDILFTAPTAIRAIKKVDPEGKLIKDYDINKLKALFLAGERCDPDTLAWGQKHLGVPVVDHWWQTETGWAICSNCLGIEALPVVSGSPSLPVPGYDVQVLDSEGNTLAAGEEGSLVVKLPLPPGTFTNLWNAPDRYQSAYFSRFPGYYETGDAGFINNEGYVFVMARTDDVINVAGHRLSTGAIEEVLAAHPDVAECAVMGAADSLKGQLPLGLVILNDGCTREVADIENDLISEVRNKIGPVAAFKSVAVVKRLPKTRSGKILRGTMRSIADSKQWTMPATIEDPDVLQEIKDALHRLGYAKTP